MWQLVLDRLLQEVGRRTAQWVGSKTAGEFFNDELSKDEAYADRIKREFRLRDYHQAWELYDSNRAYWKELYGDDPLNSRNHPASPPSSLVPREPPLRQPSYNYLNPAPMDSSISGPFGTGGQFAPGSATSPRPVYEKRSSAPSDASSSDVVDNGQPIRRLVRLPGTGTAQTAFDVRAPAVPFVPRTAIPDPGRPATFDERFGSHTGQLMANPPLPPSVFGLPDNSGTPTTNLNDWFADLIKPRSRR